METGASWHAESHPAKGTDGLAHHKGLLPQAVFGLARLEVSGEGEQGGYAAWGGE